MANPFSTPEWFYGTDVTLNALAVIICLVLAIYSLRIYKLTKEKKFQLFSLAFFSIVIGFLFKVGTDTFLYLIFNTDYNFGITLTESTGNPLYYLIPFFFFHFFTLLGFLGLFCLAHEIKSVKVFLLFAYLVSVSSWFVNAKYLSYHVTAAVILFAIFVYYFQNVVQKKKNNNKLVMTAFLLLTLSEIAFVFLVESQIFYVLGEVIRIGGFLLLLINFIFILKK